MRPRLIYTISGSMTSKSDRGGGMWLAAGSQLRDRAFPKNCQLVGREDGSCRTHEGLRAIASRTSNMPIRLAPMIGSGRLFETRFGRCAQIRRIEIIFTGDSKPA